jgi:hypothetical protein
VFARVGIQRSPQIVPEYANIPAHGVLGPPHTEKVCGVEDFLDPRQPAPLTAYVGAQTHKRSGLMILVHQL